MRSVFARREAAGRIDGRVDVLLAVAVVEHDPAAVVQGLRRPARARPGRDARRVVQAPPPDRLTSPKRPRVKVSVTVSVCGSDEHALVALEVAMLSDRAALTDVGVTEAPLDADATLVDA